MGFKTMAAVASLVVAGGLALAAAPANASTLLCTGTESCGGADLAVGSLSLSVLGKSTVNGGFGYNNEEVGFTTSGATNGTQDFTVFQDASETTPGHGGVYGFGNYVAMYTPGGKLPLNSTTPGSTATDSGNGASVAYCISVEDTYPKVGGHTVQRWALVLRNCFAWPGTKFNIGNKAPGEHEDTVTHPDVYQLWAPTETADGYLKFQDVALNSTHYRHGFGGGNFVMDDRGFGGSGTWGLAYPDKQGGDLNQKFTIIGCTQPVTVFNSTYYNCAGV